MDRRRTASGDGDRAGYVGSRSGSETSTSNNSDWNDRNDRDVDGRASRDGHGTHANVNWATWGDRKWNDPDVRMIYEAEIPSGARTCLSHEAGGTALSETGSGMWNGKQAYCAKVMKNGHPYKVISEADGNLLAMHRLD